MTADPLVSFIIPTHNRAALVCESIRSALDWLGTATDGEIVLVDDRSTDDTLARLKVEFAVQLTSGILRLVPLARNGGVIKAKNAGAAAARGHWLIFLDSDDLIISSAAGAMRQAFSDHATAPALFFRCENLSTGELLGTPQQSYVHHTLRDYLRAIAYSSPYAECLPVVRRDVAIRFPYDERLNGMEGLAYARMMRAIGPFVILPVVARRYREDGDDRLSSAAGIRRRSRALALGHWLVLREFGSAMTLPEWGREAAKVVFYLFRAVKSGLKR